MAPPEATLHPALPLLQRPLRRSPRVLSQRDRRRSAGADALQGQPRTAAAGHVGTGFRGEDHARRGPRRRDHADGCGRLFCRGAGFLELLALALGRQRDRGRTGVRRTGRAGCSGTTRRARSVALLPSLPCGPRLLSQRTRAIRGSARRPTGSRCAGRVAGREGVHRETDRGMPAALSAQIRALIPTLGGYRQNSAACCGRLALQAERVAGATRQRPGQRSPRLGMRGRNSDTCRPGRARVRCGTATGSTRRWRV